MNQTFTKVTKSLGILALTSFTALTQAQTFNWSAAGPIYTAGRARNMVVDKIDNNGQVLYVGSSTSGIFKSTNAGLDWAPLNDQGTVRNISYLAQAFDGVIFAATGEGFLRPGEKTKALPGTGLYKLVGNNLVSVASASITGVVINRVACHPSNKDKIAIATNFGVLYSQDGGTNFNVLSPSTTTANLTYGLDVKFDVNGILYFSIGSELGTTPFTNVSSKVYRSTDNSLTAFTNITPTNSALSDANYGRIELAIAPSNPNVIYASCSKKYTSGSSSTLQGLFVSGDGGATWGLIVQGSPQLDPLSNGGSIASGDYSHVITVHPTIPELLFVGGYKFSLWNKNSTSSYANPIGTWATQIGSPAALNTPFYLHENIHDIKIIGTGTNPKCYFITDAGIYRSIDLFNGLTLPSFQPFYKGLVTGQFNSVSIESFPLAANATGTAGAVTPYSGFIGGTGATGLTYFSGNFPNVTSEILYLSGEVYNAEYSKILADAAILTSGSGGLYRTSNAKNAAPTLVNVNYYTGNSSVIVPEINAFSNVGYNSTAGTPGTPFKLWENYGQIPAGPDNAVFYNDSAKLQSVIVGLNTLTTQTTFTFAAARPNRFALIDSIVVRTATVSFPGNSVPNIPTPFTASDKKDLFMSFNPSYTPAATGTTAPSFTVRVAGSPTFPAYGPNPSNGAFHGATLNATSLVDNISITFTAPPFANKTQTFANIPDPATYYRVFATVFYKYKAGDSIIVKDNSISTKVFSYSTVLTQPLNWRYGTGASYVLSANVSTAIPNPTFVLTPGNIQSPTPTFTVNAWQSTTYSITQYGTYTLNAKPVTYTLSATTDTNLANSYTLYPGVITQTSNVFTVTPTAATVYTITQGTGTLTGDTNFTIAASSYSINPGNITQSGLSFVVTPTAIGTATAVTTTYTIQGISSNTVLGANTSTTFPTQTARTSSVVGVAGVPFAPNNGRVKIPMTRSARLAVALNVQQITGTNQNAVVVSKEPLSLNDGLSFVRVSQSGCLTDDATGAPTNSTITIPGKAVLIEWSKKGTELYYATDDYKVYRVSHITDIMDLSSSSFFGKFNTDIFAYNSVSPYTPNTNTINPGSPYRTTLIGAFTKPITSMSITKDDSLMAITFNDPSPTTGTIVMYSTNDIRKSNSTNIGWVKKDGTGLSGVISYCSLMEKSDNKKVFIGTDNGIFYTGDIGAASPTWVNANNNQLPNVQIFDIEQQVLSHSESYNSGQIYVATNGRGVWVNNAYLDNYVISVTEIEKIKTENNLTIYPNPTNGSVYLKFPCEAGESPLIHVYDINGRLVKSENLGKVYEKEVTHQIETSEMSQGIYIVKVTGDSGIKRASKLIVTK